MTKVLSELDFFADMFEWSLERYHNAIEAGILTENDSLELIKGKLVKKMPISEDHAYVIEFLADFFRERFGRKYRYRSENPVTFLDNSEPEPDFVVAQKPSKSLLTKHPKPADVHLIIEVAKSTVQYDRKVKGMLYAEADIAEYWIINLKSRKIEVHLSPDRDENSYETMVSYAEGESFSSPFAGEIVVADLLPPTSEVA
jgi:Uma2 family endonuclease